MSDVLEKDTVESFSLGLEKWMHVSDVMEDMKTIYVLLTDTKTLFNRLSTKVTKQNYNHISLIIDNNLDEIYTFSLSNGVNIFGGFQVEDREDLNGSRYRLYAVEVTEAAHLKLTNKISEYKENIANTSYSFKSLVNALFKTDIFDNEDESNMICSLFVLSMLTEAGVEGFDKKSVAKLRPNELIRSKKFRYVRRGTISTTMNVSIEWI